MLQQIPWLSTVGLLKAFVPCLSGRMEAELQVLQHVGVSGRGDPVLCGHVHHQLVGGPPDQRHRLIPLHLRQLQETR